MIRGRIYISRPVSTILNMVAALLVIAALKLSQIKESCIDLCSDALQEEKVISRGPDS